MQLSLWMEWMKTSEFNIDIQKAHSLFELFKRTFEEIYKNLKKRRYPQIRISSMLEEAIFEQVIEQYVDHSQRYNIDVTDVCPYKFLAWSGYMLANNVYSNDTLSRTFAKLSIYTAIIAMRRLLKEDGVKIENSFLKKVLRMVLSEIRGSKTGSFNDCQLGLGMNGFYMMFRTASICEKDSKIPPKPHN